MSELGNCEKCGRKMEMYYTPWCPHCDKPIKEFRPVLNFIQCLEHIEVKYDKPGYKRRVWAMLSDYIHNDTVILWPYNYDDDWEFTDEQQEDVNLFHEVFDIKKDDALWIEVSW